MQTLAILAKTCKGNRLSSWEFYKDDNDRYFAKSNANKLIRARDIEDLRRFYKKMLDWGFNPAAMPSEDDA